MKPLKLQAPDDLYAPQLVRELLPHDLQMLETVRGEQKPISLTRRMTMRHHSLAKCIATGMSNWEASAITGYAEGTISVLRGDPAFKELVEFYKKRVDQEFVDIAQRLRNIAADALDLAHQRMEDNPEEVTMTQALELAKTALDRSGFGPSQTTTNIQVNIGDRLKSARERMARLKDITPTDA